MVYLEGNSIHFGRNGLILGHIPVRRLLELERQVASFVLDGPPFGVAGVGGVLPAPLLLKLAFFMVNALEGFVVFLDILEQFRHYNYFLRLCSAILVH